MPTADFPLPNTPKPCVAPEGYVYEAYHAIGKLMVMYARAEVDLSTTINDFIRTRVFKIGQGKENLQVLAALTGSIRMEKSRTLVLDLAKRINSSVEDLELVKRGSDHLKILAQFRNRIGHYGAFPMGIEGKWIIQTSTKYNVRDYDKREIWQYSIEAALAAADDCFRATTLIDHALFPERRTIRAEGLTNYDPLEAFSFNRNMIKQTEMS